MTTAIEVKKKMIVLSAKSPDFDKAKVRFSYPALQLQLIHAIKLPPPSSK